MKKHLLSVAIFSAFTCSVLSAAALDHSVVVNALKRGTLGKLPAHLVITDAQFSETSRVDNDATVKGDAVFTSLEDTFIAVRRIGVKRPSGELNATVIRRVHIAGEKFISPFQGIVSLLDSAPRLVPQMIVSEHGEPRSSFKAAVIEGTPEHKQLLALNETFASTDERYQRVKDKWARLNELGELLSSYDAWAATHPASIEGRIVRALDSKDLGKAYDQKVYRSKKLVDGRAKHAAFVQLVKPTFDAEYARIKAIADPREAAAQAYIDFLEKL